MFNGAVGREILALEAVNVNTFSLCRTDIQECMKGSYKEAGHEIKIEVYGKLVPLEVVFGHASGECRVFHSSRKPCTPEELADWSGNCCAARRRPDSPPTCGPALG